MIAPHLLHPILSMFRIVATSAVMIGLIHAAADPWYRIVGTYVETEFRQGAKPEEKQRAKFEVTVKDFDWMIQVRPEQWVAASASDAPLQRATREVVLDHTVWAAAGEFFSVKAFSRGSVTQTNACVGPGAVPFGIGSDIDLLWQSYASQSFHDSRTRKGRPAFVSPITAFAFTDFKLMSQAGRLSASSLRDQSGFFNGIQVFWDSDEMKVPTRTLALVSATNIAGLHFPLTATLIQFEPWKEIEPTPRRTNFLSLAILKEVGVMDSNFSLPAPLTDRTPFNEWDDLRISGSVPPLTTSIDPMSGSSSKPLRFYLDRKRKAR